MKKLCLYSVECRPGFRGLLKLKYTLPIFLVIFMFCNFIKDEIFGTFNA